MSDGLNALNISLRQLVKDKIFKLLEEVDYDKKILILDKATVKTIDAALSLPEILDRGIYLVENINIGRQPFPKMSAIYLLEATDANIDLILKDFTLPTKKLASGRTGPMYIEAHLFFTTPIYSSLMNKLAQGPVAPFVKSIQEIYLNFVPQETRVFHLGNDPIGFYEFVASSILEDPSPNFLTYMDNVASQLASACITLGEVPRIRYQSYSSKKPAICYILAQKVNEFLEEHSKKLELKPKSNRATLLICDRTIDLLSPLLHEFTIQAMATDLLDLGTDGSKYQYSFSTLAGPQKKIVSLTEEDHLWMSLRHSHIADCSNVIIEKFNKFLLENKAALRTKTSTTSNDVTSLAELKDTMAALSEFHEMKSEFSLHLSLAQDCLSSSDSKQLISVATVEQGMATGVTADGDPYQKTKWNDLSQLLLSPALTSNDKLRLLAIYFLTTSKVDDSEIEALTQASKIDREELRKIKKLLVVSSRKKYSQRESGRPKGSKRHSCIDDPSLYEVSRYMTACKLIAEDCIYNELSLEEFPFLDNESSLNVNPASKVAASSLRAKTIGSSVPKTEGTIILFVLGGCTYSEVRSTYELAESTKRNIYIGGDSLIIPEKFLQYLA